MSRSRNEKKSYLTLTDLVYDVADILQPPERLTVSQSAEKYRFLNNTGSYVGPWRNDMTPYLVEPANCLNDREYNAVIFVGPAQTGKALALDTPLATPTGWTTMGDVQVGDVLFDEKGRPCRVTFATEVMNDHTVYYVEFDDGSRIKADAEHKWTVDDIWGSAKTLTTGQMLDSYRVAKSGGRSRSRYAIPVAGPLELEPIDLPMDPYLLGLWLGDGNRHTGYLCLGNSDVDALSENLEARGFGVTRLKQQEGKTAHTICVKDEFGDSMRVNLNFMGLLGGDKRIPLMYLRASELQRRELLRGLMDTDGTVDKGTNRVYFATSEVSLLRGVEELVASLGYKYTVDAKIPKYKYLGEEKTGDAAFKVNFTVYDSTECFSLDRHAARFAVGAKTRQGQTKRRWITSITPTDSVPVKCIQVDSPSHLFLAGKQMIPTHNTDGLILNWITHSVVADPADMLLIEKSQTSARDFSRRRIDRLHRHSKEVGRRLVKRRDSDNTFDKMYMSGMLLTLSYPAINELSGRPVPRVALTDYDRMPENIDGEGSPFDLARKRTTSFRSFAKTLAESSPGFSVEDLRALPRTPHEAPPCRGILSLYNRGDRRRWYWPCPHCRAWFEADFELLDWPDSADLVECAEAAYMRCPHCFINTGAMITQGMKHDLNQEGVWVKDGQRMTRDGLIGLPVRSDIASFWMKGVAAAFASWKTLVLNYLKAEQEFERTGSQEALKSTVNTDQGKPYIPRGTEVGRLPEELKNRAEDLGEKVVPFGVLFLLAHIDVQKNSWVVQVKGIGRGFDVWLIDRFKIVKSKRKDDDGDTLWVKPHTYLEDWDLLIEQVMTKTYPLADGSGRHMQIMRTTCDSGGKKGVTSNAYAFWKRLRDDKEGRQLHKRFHLTKGDPAVSAPRVRVSYPDSGTTKGRTAGARGEVPVLMINTNTIKDMLNAKLDNLKPGSGMIHFPKWLPDEVYAELTVEQKTAKGWENLAGHPNEAWDLFVYDLALCVHLQVERMDWEEPPGWANEWDYNDLVFQYEKEQPKFTAKKKEDNSLAALAATLA